VRPRCLRVAASRWAKSMSLGRSVAAVLGYLARLRIDHPEALEAFRLGYADRTLGLRLPDKRRKDGAELRGRPGEARDLPRQRS